MSINLGLLLDIGLACLLAFFLARVAIVYAQTTGTWWERLLATSSGSAVLLKEYAVFIGGGVLIVADYGTQVLGLPEAQKLIDNVPPGLMGWVLIGTAVLGVLARLRTLGSK